MEANDLRINNFISLIHKKERMFNTDSPLCVMEVKTNQCVVKTSEVHITMIAGYEDIQPIPLTEQWLLRFGFEKTISKIGTKGIDYIDYRMNQFVCFLLPNSKGLEVEFWPPHNNINERGYIKTVQYVHQLQNLYYALTGEELTLSETL